MHELNTLEALPKGGGRGGGSDVVFYVWILKHLTSVFINASLCYLEIEQIFFVFVRILEKGDSNAL